MTIDPFLTKFWLSFAKIKKETKWTTSPRLSMEVGGQKISVIHHEESDQDSFEGR